MLYINKRDLINATKYLNISSDLYDDPIHFELLKNLIDNHKHLSKTKLESLEPKFLEKFNLVEHDLIKSMFIRIIEDYRENEFKKYPDLFK